MATGKRSHKGRRRGLRWVLFALLLVALGALVAGLLGATYPLLDLANLVRVPAAVAAMVLSLLLAWLTARWGKRALYGFVILGSAYLLLPVAESGAACPPGAPSLRVAWVNVQGTMQPGPVLEWLEEEQVDVAAFGELFASQEETRNAIFSAYPFWQACLPNGRCGTVIAAREEPSSTAPLSRGDAQNRKTLAAARMTVALDGDAPLRLIAVHLSRPPEMARQRLELAQLQGHLDRPSDTILLGDFNMVSRMHGLSSFTRSNGLRITKADRPTWPLWWDGRSRTPLIQIDHMLAGRNWRVGELRTSDDLGSDHRGIVTDICRDTR